MKKIWITIGFCLSSLLLSAQVDIDLMGGTSKADRSFSAFQATWVGARGFRAGVQVHNGDYQYRFIDARAVNGGNVTETRLILRFPLSVQEKIRLDASLHPGVRWLQAPTEPQELEYGFEDAQAFILEPGLTVTFFPTQKLSLHTGFNAHMAWQTSPETIFEQFPSGLLRVGGAYSLTDKWSVFTDLQSGPMSGASGDSEKYGWKLAVGLRFRLGKETRHQLLSGF